MKHAHVGRRSLYVSRIENLIWLEAISRKADPLTNLNGFGSAR